MSGVASAIEKMQSLSPERVERVVTLIEDLAQLEAKEDAEDAVIAAQALARHKRDGGGLTLDELEKFLAS